MRITAMSRSLHGVLALSMALVVSACAGPQYEQDYRPETDFNTYSTYVWRTGTSQIPGFDLERIEGMAQPVLEEQGLHRDLSAPDLLITFNAFTRRSTGGSKGVGLSIGLPIGSSGRVGVGGSRTLADEDKQEGVLVMDILDARTNQLLWRGNASGIPLEHFRLDSEQRLQRSVEKLVRQYPPN